jgi:hypothetical protein
MHILKKTRTLQYENKLAYVNRGQFVRTRDRNWKPGYEKSAEVNRVDICHFLAGVKIGSHLQQDRVKWQGLTGPPDIAFMRVCMDVVWLCAMAHHFV